MTRLPGVSADRGGCAESGKGTSGGRSDGGRRCGKCGRGECCGPGQGERRSVRKVEPGVSDAVRHPVHGPCRQGVRCRGGAGQHGGAGRPLSAPGAPPAAALPRCTFSPETRYSALRIVPLEVGLLASLRATQHAHLRGRGCAARSCGSVTSAGACLVAARWNGEFGCGALERRRLLCTTTLGVRGGPPQRRRADAAGRRTGVARVVAFELTGCGCAGGGPHGCAGGVLQHAGAGGRQGERAVG